MYMINANIVPKSAENIRAFAAVKHAKAEVGAKLDEMKSHDEGMHDVFDGKGKVAVDFESRPSTLHNLAAKIANGTLPKEGLALSNSSTQKTGSAEFDGDKPVSLHLEEKRISNVKTGLISGGVASSLARPKEHHNHYRYEKLENGDELFIAPSNNLTAGGQSHTIVLQSPNGALFVQHVENANEIDHGMYMIDTVTKKPRAADAAPV